MSYGRQYARSGDIFASIDDVIQFGVARAISDSDDEREQTAVETQREESWELLCSRIPNFRSEMVALADQRKLRRRVARKIGEGVHNVRAEDASSLKNMILDYLLMDTTAQLDPQIKRKGKKADRGFQHRVTAALLCPLKYEATQQTYSDILAGKKCLTAYDLPRFLYPDGHAYNPDDMDTGVLHGHLLLRVAKHIFQGPTAALERPGYHRGRRGNAALMGMTAMTPRAIAYIAIQARFAISAVDTWAPVEGNFDYNAFFWVIVSLFDDGEGEDIIKLYNEYVSTSIIEPF
ncbi:hypothetical protein BDZ97DRAFT_1811726 [Flammula alnicola]|nr:hypothetical protein BDZ97DRAFT_1874936 [Flammula alnicola]KAF8965365.1 hypothetical protein BDZ97DRAFT_1811726 [Flammula alnicola]